MARCEVCGNDYYLAFQVVTAGVTHTFDCFECAIHKLAPICASCGCKIVGHGIEAKGTFFCCAHCAHAKGASEIVDNADHVGAVASRPSAQPVMRASDPADMGRGPAESWRGSGLAEDIGVSQRSLGSDDSDPDRAQRMREAEQKLGWSDPDDGERR